ncbi:MAG: cytochrome c [Leptospirales bacterium]
MKKYFTIIGLALLFLSGTMFCGKKIKPVAVNAQEVFKINCQTCHGEWGEGDGPLSNSTDGKPRDYIKEGFKYGRDRASVIKSIENGFPDSGMPGYGDKLSTAEIDAVAAYTIRLFIRQ